MTADFLSYEVSDNLAALGYIWVSVICLLLAWDLWSYAFTAPCPMPPRWLYNRLYFARFLVGPVMRLYCIFTSLHFWFGAFLGTSDAVLYGIIGVNLIRSRDPTYLWSILIISCGILTATMMFVLWVRGKTL